VARYCVYGAPEQAVKRVTFLIRLFLAAIFLYSGFIKASASAQFAVALLPFTFVPESWRLPLSIVLPVSEIAGGALILAPWTQRIGALLILGLCLLFIAALGWALANDVIVSCSCFGREEQPSVAKMSLTLLRDVFVAALALIVLFAGGARTLRTRGG
jgi:uncharacterized membrane protein YphA (DoxX/SURF4 family)